MAIEDKCNSKRGTKEKVGPDFEDVVKYSISNGAIDLSKMQELEGRYASEGYSRRCDVKKGPCGCGAWH
jgi:hypothetical protein